MQQNSLFAAPSGTTPDATRIILYALADFQARKLALAGRELPLDRLRGALRRAAETLDMPELTDEQAATALQELGAKVRRVPVFVAKHPFRITVSESLADRASQYVAAQKPDESVTR